MATTDNGGLNWNLNVTDNFTGPLQKFTQLVTQAKAAMDAFKGDRNAFSASVEQLKALTELTKAQTSASRENRQQENQAAREQLARQRELAAAIKARTQAEKDRAAILRSFRGDQEAAAKAALGLDAALARTAGNTKRTAEETTKASAQTSLFSRQIQQLRGAFLGGSEAGNRLIFTLRNIIGVGAGLVVIQKIQQGFSDLVRSGIDFNASVENSEIGIAGLLTAVTSVRNAQGELVTGSVAFGAAQEVAIRQTELLRQATLRTTATFEQLADTFQIAVAPGLKAGLDIDQIRELAVSVSQAAGALGVPTNQLSEEIRALLTGTIQARTTRIATALGIRPDDIARAKNDVGGLAKFLDDRFKAFELAGERAAGTFTGTFNRARVAISLATGQASTDLFEEVRASFLSVFDSFTERDALGRLLPNENAVQVLREVFDGIAAGVRAVRETILDLDFDDILAVATSLGRTFRALGEVASGFVQGAITGFRALGVIFDTITSAVTNLSRNFGTLFEGVDLQLLARRFAEIITVVGGLSTALSLVKTAVGALTLPFTVLASLNPFVIGIAAGVTFVAVLTDILKLSEDIAKTQEGSTAEAQLSKTAIARQKVTDNLKLQQQLLTNIDKAIAEGDEKKQLRGEIRLRQTQQDLVALKEALAVEQARDQLDPNRRAGNDAGAAVEVPIDPRTNSEKAIQVLRDLLVQLNDAASATPVEVPIEPVEPASGLGTSVDELAKKAKLRPAELPLTVGTERFTLESKEALDKFGETLTKMGEMTEAGLNLMKSAISEFGSFVADTLVDAFDPTNDATFKERFARFLQSLAKQIIATLTQIAVAKLLLSIGVGAAGGTTVAAEGGLVGLAEGGPVPGSGGIPSPNHFGIKGPRPKGLDPTDTVAAWLAPGEFVHRASAVAKYGADFMSALNAGLLDPGQLRGLAGLSARHSQEVQRARRIAGFADGGLISQQVASSAAAVAETGNAPNSATIPTPAFIVGNDKAADRFLRGGKSAVVEFFRENADTFKAILGQ